MNALMKPSPVVLDHRIGKRPTEGQHFRYVCVCPYCSVVLFERRLGVPAADSFVGPAYEQPCPKCGKAHSVSRCQSPTYTGNRWHDTVSVAARPIQHRDRRWWAPWTWKLPLQYLVRPEDVAKLMKDANP